MKQGMKQTAQAQEWIHFNKPAFTGGELACIEDAVKRGTLCGDGFYTKACSRWMEERYGAEHVLLTTSCTHALEMAAYLCGLKEGDEVIMPSYTFVSTADAFVLRGARIVFVDIRPDTMNLDETKLLAAISDRTRVIVPVHYAGVSCEMDLIGEIARDHHLCLVEDAAQGVGASYKGRALGTIGDYGCYSFHETKNYTMGEGGALLLRGEEAFEQAEILREKGTDRSRFFRGQVDKYRWVGYGSSYLPSELNAAYLYPQLQMHDEILNQRLSIWNFYHENLKDLADRGLIEQPHVPEGCVHNAHMYYIKAKDLAQRSRLLAWLKDCSISSVFHYIPLHSSPAGKRFGVFSGQDEYTTRESERLLRLPICYNMDLAQAGRVVEAVHDFEDFR